MRTGETLQSETDWCPFCGARFRNKSRKKEIYFNGRTMEIHKDEYREFQETGILKYLNGPRSFPLSQDAIDLGMLAVAAVVIGLYFMWVLTSIGA
jgi:hypothetical protein